MSLAEELIKKSGLSFLKGIDFEEQTPGRFFQKEKLNLGQGFRQFYVILGPNIESPIHNHAGQNMSETHMLLYGEGKFIIYDDKGRENQQLVLDKGKFHQIFSTTTKSPDHKYIAGPEGSITLALEKYGPGGIRTLDLRLSSPE